MTRAAVYVRVSTETQSLNASLDTQEAACRAFAAELGLDHGRPLRAPGGRVRAALPDLGRVTIAGRRRHTEERT